MEAYEIYWRDENGEANFIGILPERRKDRERVTQKSILNWGRKVIDDDAELKDVFFTKVTLDKNLNGIVCPKPSVEATEIAQK
jgi:hypothetical protein